LTYKEYPGPVTQVYYNGIAHGFEALLENGKIENLPFNEIMMAASKNLDEDYFRSYDVMIKEFIVIDQYFIDNEPICL